MEKIIFEELEKPTGLLLKSDNFTDEQIQTIFGMIDNWFMMYPDKVIDYDIEIEINVKNIKWSNKKEV